MVFELSEKKSGFGLILWSTDIEQNGEICNSAKNANVWRAKKPTSGVPTKMFDPSKERSWSEFFDDLILGAQLGTENNIIPLICLPN